MPNPFPYLPLYVNDWLVGTREMSLAAKGMYAELIAYQWDKGSIPEKRSVLIRLTGCEADQFDSIWDEVKSHFEPAENEPGRLINRRLADERSKALEKSRKNSENGKLGGRPGSKADEEKPDETETVPNDDDKGNQTKSETKANGLANAKPEEKPIESESKGISEFRTQIGDCIYIPPTPQSNPWDGYPENLRTEEFHELWVKWLTKRAKNSGGRFCDQEDIDDALAIVAKSADPIDFVKEAIHGNWNNLYNLEKKREGDAKGKGGSGKGGQTQRQRPKTASERFAHLGGQP